MTSRERVLNAFRFGPVDRIPRFINCWPEHVEQWAARHGNPPDPGTAIRDAYGSDMMVVEAREEPWPSREQVLERKGGVTLRRTAWGSVVRDQDGAFFSETLSVAVPERTDPDALQFDDPLLDSRYGSVSAAVRQRYAVFCKTGGAYIRAQFMRGEEQWLIDMVEDPGWTRRFVERLTDHLITVGVESLRRFRLQETGIGIYDDVCSLTGPIMGRKTYEALFYPSLCRMVKAYKAAGAAYVFHHCDGNMEDLLDLWVAAGIDAVHPLEPRAGLDLVRIRAHYPRLVIVGGLDNCVILPRGDRAEIARHIARLRAVTASGGFIIAPHTIGPDISLETMDYVLDLLA